MKKILLFIMSTLIFLAPAFSDEWDGLLETDRSWDGQKSITNKEFEEAINTLEGKKKKKEEKKRKKMIKKVSGGGTSLHSELNPTNDILTQTPLSSKSEDSIINIPADIESYDGKILEKGYYKIIAQKENSQIYLLFYQSQFYKGKIKAKETQNDYEKETLNFVDLLPYNDDYVKIIFGSMDFNAYSYAKIHK